MSDDTERETVRGVLENPGDRDHRGGNDPRPPEGGCPLVAGARRTAPAVGLLGAGHRGHRGDHRRGDRHVRGQRARGQEST